MSSRIMQNMSGVKQVNMATKVLSPHSKTLPGDGFGCHGKSSLRPSMAGRRAREA